MSFIELLFLFYAIVCIITYIGGFCMAYSERCNDPAFAKYLKNMHRWTWIFSFVISAIAVVGFLYMDKQVLKWTIHKLSTLVLVLGNVSSHLLFSEHLV